MFMVEDNSELATKLGLGGFNARKCSGTLRLEFSQLHTRARQVRQLRSWLAYDELYHFRTGAAIIPRVRDVYVKNSKDESIFL